MISVQKNEPSTKAALAAVLFKNPKFY